MIKQLAAAALIPFLFTGCASVINDPSHPMKVETMTPTGERVTGADCKMTNDRISTEFKSGDTVQVRRSGQDLDISCKDAQHGEASARAISRASGGMFGNILLGGGIGAIVDHNRGTAYTYPTWIQMVFGRPNMVFDRSAEETGKPTPPTDPNAAKPAAASGAAGPAGS